LAVCRRAGLRVALSAAAALFALEAAGVSRADDEQVGMTFTLQHSNSAVALGEGSRDYIYAEGRIYADTPTKFEQFLKDHPPTSPNVIVVLNSPGGSVEGGLALGRAIRAHKFWTQVGSALPLAASVSPSIPAKSLPYLHRPLTPPFTGSCVSACTIVYLGGVYRFMDYGSEYGVHRFFSEGQPGPNTEAETQEVEGLIVQYVAEMGADPRWVTEMSKGGKTFAEVIHLTMNQMIQLKVVTPRWQTNWAFNTTDGGVYYLASNTWDPWGEHEIDFACYRPSGAAPMLTATFHVNPGNRGVADDLVKAVQKYYLLMDTDDPIELQASLLTKAAAVNGRLATTVKLSGNLADKTDLMKSTHLGFALTFDPAAKLPMQLLQFNSDFDAKQVQKFAAGCK